MLVIIEIRFVSDPVKTGKTNVAIMSNPKFAQISENLFICRLLSLENI